MSGRRGTADSKADEPIADEVAANELVANESAASGATQRLGHFDSVVRPAVAFDLGRTHRMFQALARRRRRVEQQTATLATRHQAERDEDQTRWETLRTRQTDQCRAVRRKALSDWDDDQEQLFADYESEFADSIRSRNQALVLSKRQAEDRDRTIVRKVDARIAAVRQQYENHKNTPGRISRKEVGRIDETLAPIAATIAAGQQLVIRRLGALPVDAGAANTASQSTVPQIAGGDVDSVDDAIEALRRLRDDATRHVEALSGGAISRIGDSFYLPLAAVGAAAVWTAIMVAASPTNRWMWIAAGLFVILVIAIVVFFVLQWPIRRQTRRAYPDIERTRGAAETVAQTGRRISREIARRASEDLVKSRDAHLAAAERWHAQQIDESKQAAQRRRDAILEDHRNVADQRASQFRSRLEEISQQHRRAADQVAADISLAIVAIAIAIGPRPQRSGRRAAGRIDGAAAAIDDGATTA